MIMDTMLAKKEPVSLNVDFDISTIRNHFPVLNNRIDSAFKLAYLDSAASSQLPSQVSNRLHDYYQHEHSNVHRSVHTLGEKATKNYEDARSIVAKHLNARSEKEIIFTRGTTDSINLVMHSFGRVNLKEGDEIIITALEHHSNIVPWQMLCKERGCVLRVAPINRRGELIYSEYLALLNKNTKLVAIGHTSNAIGTVNPVQRMIADAKKFDAVTVVDGAQGVPHSRIDVQELGCDYLAFSGHKMYGPTGIGILYANENMFEKMGPYLGGGDMILRVTFEETIYNDPPYKFEAGTPPIAGVIGLGEAIKFIERVGIESIASHEKALLDYAHEQVAYINEVTVIGTAKRKSAVLSFVMGDIHAHDIGSILNSFGVAVRAGHHCAQPVMEHFNVPATARASFAMYNNFGEIDALVDGIKEVREIFA